MINKSDVIKKIKKISEVMIQSVFPRRCPVCEEITKGEYICPDCIKKLHFVKEPICMLCGKEIRSADEELCFDCIKKMRSFEFGRALLCYDEIAENAMIKIKYKNKREYIEVFAKLLVYRYRSLLKKINADCVMPVPIHASRRRERGYNQAELIARIVAEELNLPLDTTTLLRVKATKPQKELLPDEREINLKSAFLAKNLQKEYKKVILIDDIFTTGSTVESCTKALNKDRKIEVYSFCLCIGMGRN